MARRVEDYGGLTLQTGRRYVLHYDVVDTSVNPLGVPNQRALGEVVAGRTGVTLESVNRAPFSQETGVTILWDGPNLEVPTEAFPLRFQVPGELVGSATVKLVAISVGERVSEATREQSRDRESDVIQQPTAGPDIGGTVGSALSSPLLLVIAAVAFAFTGAGQKIVKDLAS